MAYAGNVLEVLEKVAAQKGLPIKNESGSYVTGIGGIQAGIYGGWDGWKYAVSRDGAWIDPDVGMKDFKLKEADRVLVYYAGNDTQLVNSLTLSASQPGGGGAFLSYGYPDKMGMGQRHKYFESCNLKCIWCGGGGRRPEGNNR